MKYLAAILAGSCLALPASAHTPEETAAAALEAAPVWDGHNDVPIQLRARLNNQITEFDFHDTLSHPVGSPETQPMHTDLVRLRKGKVGAQFWSVYVSADLAEPDAVQATIEQIDVTKRLIERYPGDLAIALGSEDVERALTEGKIASLMGMEGGHSIGSSLAVLRQMYDLGARYMTLTHSKNTPWADSATDEAEHGGLNEFGLDVVREMNRIGMLVDLSHVSAEAMHDALDVTKAPVIFSHSGAQAVNGHARNVPDDVLVRLKGNGGIVMVVALTFFVNEDVRIWREAAMAEQARLAELHKDDAEQLAAARQTWLEANPQPVTTVSDVADHIDHIRDVAGIEHIGIGGDYDGMPPGPVGMEDVSGYPNLFSELARRGYSQDELEKISFRNMMRVMRAAEAHAASVREDTPIETRLETAS
ncbi:dipeptidase [Altererythrobacter sp. MF3-039]|uniref:dipeptidase n=1 Tax=Altererythrobacter sp. MF3-039 TaxID=3252901 RepID=UPI00390C48EE